jgi:hypothetical protein
VSDYREGELLNPEGFPCCPKCGGYVATHDAVFGSGILDMYYCWECKYSFPLEEATLGDDYFSTEEDILEL